MRTERVSVDSIHPREKAYLHAKLQGYCYFFNQLLHCNVHVWPIVFCRKYDVSFTSVIINERIVLHYK